MRQTLFAAKVRYPYVRTSIVGWIRCARSQTSWLPPTQRETRMPPPPLSLSQQRRATNESVRIDETLTRSIDRVNEGLPREEGASWTP